MVALQNLTLTVVVRTHLPLVNKRKIYMPEKIVARIPASETGPNVTHTTRSGIVYKVTQNKKKGQFTLWKKVEGGYEKLATKKSPVQLYPLFDIEE